MKALTLHQPWASLIAAGVKTIETRSWSTSYRGPLAIHAAAKMPMVVRPLSIGGYEVEYVHADVWHLIHEGRTLGRAPMGAVVATCTLTDVVPIVDYMTEREDTRSRIEPIESTLWLRVPRVVPALNVTAQLPYGDYRPGRYAWLLDDIEPLVEPVPARGRQQLWNWECPQRDAVA